MIKNTSQSSHHASTQHEEKLPAAVITKNKKEAISLPVEMFQKVQNATTQSLFREMLLSNPQLLAATPPVHIKQRIEHMSPSGVTYPPQLPAAGKELMTVFLSRFAAIRSAQAFIASASEGKIPIQSSGPVAFSASGRHFGILSDQGVYHLYNFGSKHAEPTTLPATFTDTGPEPLQDCFSPNGKHIEISHEDGSCSLVAVDKPGQLLPISTAGFGGKFSPGGDKYVYMSEEEGVRIFDLTQNSPSAALLTLPCRGYVRAAFSANGDKLALAGMDGTIAVVDLTSAGQTAQVIPAAGRYATALTFTPTGSHLVAIISSDQQERSVKSWDLAKTASPCWSIACNEKALRLSCSKDAKYLLIEGYEASDEVWSLETVPKPIAATNDPNMARHMAISADCRYVLRHSSDDITLFPLEDPSAQPISLSNPALKDANLEDLARINVSMAPSGRQVILHGEHNIRVVDLTSTSPVTTQIWASKAAQAVLGDTFAVGKDGLSAANAAADEAFVGNLRGKPTISSDGCFLATVHEQGVKLWDVAQIDLEHG